ncbi:MAG TPA: nuclear transport factor 2 family protein, partial [Solirubrobacterales bacterium]
MALIDEAEIRRRYERLTAGDEMADLLADDFVFHQQAELPGTAGTFRGLEGVRASNAEIAESLVDLVWQPERIEQLDDGRWLTLLKVSGRGTRSGVPTETQLAHIARFDEQGRLKRLDAHGDWD